MRIAMKVMKNLTTAIKSVYKKFTITDMDEKVELKKLHVIKR